MSPQLLSRVVPDLRDFSITPGPLDRASPVLAALVMRVIATWSYVDLAVTQMVSVFLRMDFEVVNEMFLALTGSTQRRAVMDAAARSLPEGDRSLYERVMQRIRITEKHRNDFAHSIWMFSPSVPDALLLVEPKAIARHLAKFTINGRELREWVRWVNTHQEAEADWTAAPPAPELPPQVGALDPSQIMVYRENDFRRELAAVQRAELLVQTLHDALGLADNEARAAVEVLLQEGQ